MRVDTPIHLNPISEVVLPGFPPPRPSSISDGSPGPRLGLSPFPRATASAPSPTALGAGRPRPDPDPGMHLLSFSRNRVSFLHSFPVGRRPHPLPTLDASGMEWRSERGCMFPFQSSSLVRIGIGWPCMFVSFRPAGFSPFFDVRALESKPPLTFPVSQFLF